MCVHVLLINYGGYQPYDCIIQTCSSMFVDILKNKIVTYINGRYIPSNTIIFNLISYCTTNDELALLVQTFINPQYPMSWTITSGDLPQGVTLPATTPEVPLIPDATVTPTI